jgi:hypothetical protein
MGFGSGIAVTVPLRILLAGASANLALVACLAGATPAMAAGWSSQTVPAVATPAGQLAAVSCVSSGDCFAVGSGFSAGVDPSPSPPLAERWNGSRWSIQRAARVADGVLRSVSCVSGEDCVAVGARYGGRVPSGALVERWNGRRWSVERSAMSRGVDLSGVSCISITACVAVGSGPNGPMADRWNGVRWSAQRVPGPRGAQSDLSAVACMSSTSCTAVGGEFLPVGWFLGSAWADGGARGHLERAPVVGPADRFAARSRRPR